MASIDKGSWRIHESRGGQGSWHEITSHGLTVGRHADADIIVHSRTVDQRHACIQWDALNKGYLIRDLDSVNGTFVNKKLLRGESHLLQDGDSLRFGYDTQQIFRVEHIPTAPPVCQTTTSNTTQTTLQQDVTPPPIAKSSELGPHPNPQYIMAGQAMVSLSPVVLPQMMSYGLVPGTNQLVAIPGLSTPQLIPATPTHQVAPVTPVVQSFLATPPSQPTSQPASDKPAVQPVMDTPTSDHGASLSGGKKVRIRWDGRRPIPKEEIPSLSKASGLYGQPYWWGEEENMSRSGGLSDSELDPLRCSGRILRDLDTYTYKSEDEGGRNKQVRRRVLQEKAQPSSSLANVQKEMGSPATSFTIAFEEPKRPKPTRLRGRRPVSASEWKSKSLQLPARQRPPQSETMSVPHGAWTASQKPPSGAKRQSLRCKSAHTEGSPLVLRPAQAHLSTSGQNVVSSTSASKGSSLTNSSNSVSPNLEQEAIPSGLVSTGSSSLRTTTTSPTDMDHPPPKITPTSSAQLRITHNPTHIDQSSSEMALESPQLPSIPLQSVSESALGAWRSVSQPGSHQGTPRNWDFSASVSGSRPGSARKRWRDGLSEVPYGLMLAAVAARTKRVAEAAQKTADCINTLMNSVQEAGFATSTTDLSDSFSHSLPFKPPNLGLPQWSFVHKDFTQIFKNLTSIEKALKDMMVPLVATKEEVDYHSEEEQSDDEAEESNDEADESEAEQSNDETEQSDDKTSNGETFAVGEYEGKQIPAEADDESDD